MIATRSDVGEVVGTDPSRNLLERARQLSEGFANMSFELATGDNDPGTSPYGSLVAGKPA